MNENDIALIAMTLLLILVAVPTWYVLFYLGRKRKEAAEKDRAAIVAAVRAVQSQQIARALARGEDATGHCTLRELVAYIPAHQREVVGVNPCELWWTDEQGRQVNVGVKMTRQGDWRYTELGDGARKEL